MALNLQLLWESTKYPNSVMIGIAHPQDEKRLNVSKETAKMHISNLLKYVNNIPTELILNLDEASSSDWQDKRSKKVIVPYGLSNERIEYAVKDAQKKLLYVQQFQWQEMYYPH